VKVRVSDDEFIVVTNTKDKPRDMVETIGALALWLGLNLDIRIEHRMVIIRHPDRLLTPAEPATAAALPWDEHQERRQGKDRRQGNGSAERRQGMDRRQRFPG
jgi:hypothetical protein